MRNILLILHFFSYIFGQIKFPGQPELQQLYLPEDSPEWKYKENQRVKNADVVGILPQQILIRTRSFLTSSDCVGTMLTSTIAITAAHCVKARVANRDVMVFPPYKNCGRRARGIPACKVVEKFSGSICDFNGHDIALVRLSRPMEGMRDLRLSFDSPREGINTVMAGTGINFNQTCKSLISYQEVVPCFRGVSCAGNQWYCTQGTFKQISGACTGDSGGPAWAFGSGLIGITAAATVDSDNDSCTNGYSIFSNLSYYKDWILQNMRGCLKTCDPCETDIRKVVF